MNNFNLKVTNLLKSLRGDNARTAGQKFKASAFAILIGLFVGIFIMLAKGGNPFQAYKDMFISNIFSSPSQRLEYIYSTVMFIILGIGIGVSFKTGLFNIGASGQFLLAGLTTVWVGSKLDFGGGFLLQIVIAMLSGAALASIAGLIKAYFNVHEVVSTILLNWIVTYFAQFLIKNGGHLGGSNDSSIYMNDSMYLSKAEGSSAFIIALILMLLVVSGIYFLFKYTTLGYKLRVNGESTTVADYAGINKKTTTILSMSISGALVGLAGFIFYGSGNSGQIPSITQPPVEGFEAITVTLLASSSPIGAIPAGLFYAALSNSQTLSDAVAGGGNVLGVVIGIVIFLSSISASFIQIYPIKAAMKLVIMSKVSAISERRTKYNSDKAELIKEFTPIIADLKNVWRTEKMQKYKQLKHDQKMAVNPLVTMLTYEYNEETDIAIIKLKEEFENVIKTQKLLEYKDEKLRFKINLKELKQAYKDDIETLIKKFNVEYSKVKTQYIEDKKQIKVEQNKDIQHQKLTSLKEQFKVDKLNCYNVKLENMKEVNNG